MTNYTEYKVLFSRGLSHNSSLLAGPDSRGPDRLAEAVNEAIKQGWQPFGGVAVYERSGWSYMGVAKTSYFQAMVR